MPFSYAPEKSAVPHQSATYRRLPICSDENGYWYAEHQFEINRTVRRFNQCITHMSVVRNGLLDSKIIEEGNLHIELRVIVKPPKGGRTIGQ